MDVDGEVVLRGMRQDLRDAAHSVVRATTTYVAVCEGAGRHGENFMTTEIDGVWEPAVGSRVELRDPTRWATVCEVRAVFTTSGKLEVWVYLDDPDGITAGSAPSIY
jgi:hypothetical protein